MCCVQYILLYKYNTNYCILPHEKHASFSNELVRLKNLVTFENLCVFITEKMVKYPEELKLRSFRMEIYAFLKRSKPMEVRLFLVSNIHVWTENTGSGS